MLTLRSIIAWLALCVALMAGAISAAERPPAATGETALDRYINKPDPAYRWELARTVKESSYTLYVLDLTSQTWRSSDEVDRPEWKHWLSIVVPRELKHKDTAFLYIGGGENGKPAPEKAPERVIDLALDTGTVVAELGMVPNQPLRFADSRDAARVEDDLVAYSRVRYMASGDEEWLVRLAMVKSGIRAMDAIEEFLATDAGGKLDVEKFVVAGGSKRGWTTWLVGAMDERVVAIVPIVIDALNSEQVTRHHFRALGYFSAALDDYVNHGLFPDKVGTPEYRAVLNIEDPYEYRARPRLKIPKFVLNAAGDQFFLPDNSRFYYAALPEKKHLRYVPNAKHSLEGSDARESVEAVYQSVLNDTPRPKFSWRKLDDGALVVTPDDKPSEMNLWQATNPEARDFRLDVIGAAYRSTPLEPAADGTYTARVPKPAQGFTAFFVELVYPSGARYPFKFTTDVSVVPDVLLYEFPTPKK